MPTFSDKPMTGAQASYLKTLSEGTGPRDGMKRVRECVTHTLREGAHIVGESGH